MSTRVAVVDDEPAVLQVMEDILASDGLDVESYVDAESAMTNLRRDPPAAIFIDIVLPGMSGIEMCRALRAEASTSRVPILLITGYAGVEEHVQGLEVGADDFLYKPIQVRVTLARLHAVLRRAGEGHDVGKIVRGPLTIDMRRNEARLEGRVLPLSPTELLVLRALASEPDRVHGRAELVQEPVEDAVLRSRVDTLVSSLRRKLGRYHTLVDTVWGAGYRFGPLPEPPSEA
jgi:DNA-binding response OmpR family regulator